MDHDWRAQQARKSLDRILPHMERAFADDIQRAPEAWHRFRNRRQRVIVMNNFSEAPQRIAAGALAAAGMKADTIDLPAGESHPAGRGIDLTGYQSMRLEVSAPQEMTP